MKTRVQRSVIFLCAFVLIAFKSSPTLEASPQGQGQTISKDQEEGFKIAPIPIIEPVTEEGAGLAVVYRYHLSPENKTSSSSSTAIGGFITGNRSWGAGAAQTFYFKGDRFRARIAGSYADVRYNFYGIGTDAGDAGISVRMEQKGIGVLGELLYRFHGLWYGGAAYRFLDTTSSFRPNPEFDSSVITQPELDLRVAALGPRVLRDSRDNADYPREGSLFDLRLGFNGAAVGSKLHYQTYDLAYSKYISITAHQTLAVRGAACFTGDNVPFFNLCLLSTSENLRGYQASRYRDRSMLASQAEYRVEAWKRLGFAAFGGIGEIGPKIGDFTFHDILPGGGGGVRYRFTRESHVNLRFDFAWGKSSHQAYFFIGEAF